MIIWTSTLYGPLLSWLGFLPTFFPFLYTLQYLFVLVLFLLSWAHNIPILLYALLESMTFYCCYFLFGCKNYGSVLDSSYVLAIFVPITDFLMQKTYPRVLALNNYFYDEFSGKYFYRSYCINWITLYKILEINLLKFWLPLIIIN